MNNNNGIIPKDTTDVEAVKGSNIGALNIDGLYEVKKKKATNNGEMILFDDFRIGLGGADNHWGRRVFFKSMMDIKLLELTKDKYKMSGNLDKDVDTFIAKQIKQAEGGLEDGTYCPTTKALDAYPEIFTYENIRNVWGLSRKGMVLFEEEILPVLARRAAKVREMIAEQKRLRAAALRAVQNKGRDTLF